MSYEHRIRCKALLDKVVTAEEAAKMIKDGDTIGCSGFTPSGYPKAVPLALAERVKAGEKIKVNVLTGASVGPELDGLAAVGAIKARKKEYLITASGKEVVKRELTRLQDLTRIATEIILRGD